MATTAYLRVSTQKQDTNKNRHDILEFVNQKRLGHVVFYEETISGKAPWRERKIGELVEALKKDDNLVVPELSRLGRSMLECIEILSVAFQKGANVFAVKGKWQLDDTISSKVLGVVYAMLAEMEREFISARTKEALAAKKREGVKLGRPQGVYKSKLDPFEKEIQAFLSSGSTQVWVANYYQTTRQNLTRWLNQRRWWPQVKEEIKRARHNVK